MSAVISSMLFAGVFPMNRFPKNDSEKRMPASTILPFMNRFLREARLAKKIALFLLLVTWPFARALGQSQSDQQSQPGQQAQPAQQSQSQAQPKPPQKDETAADASKKAQKEKAKPKKVYTEEDLSGMKGGVSVVGEADRKGARSAGPVDPGGEQQPNGEQYWRRRARQILNQIAAIDDAIAKTKDDIKKYGSGGFDVTTGMKNNIAYINDRNGQLTSLEKRKADLEKQMDDLQEEGRKAGAQPSWFR